MVPSDVILYAISENHNEKFFGAISRDKNHNLREIF